MNKLFSAFATLFLVFLIYSFYLSTFEFKILEPKKTQSSFYYDYRVNSNIHSLYTLGSGTYGSIASEARTSKQNFLIFTDINLENTTELDRYENQVGVLVGLKNESLNKKNIIYQKPTMLNRLNYLAHPLKKSYSVADVTPEISGIEVFNLKQITQASWRKSKFSTIWSLIFYPFNPRLSLMRLFEEPENEIQFFDQISMNKKFVMYLGAEASARAIPITNLIMKFPSYERIFGVASQHILLPSELTGNIIKDRESVVSALVKGQFYIAFDELADPMGFETHVISNKKRHYLLGEEIPFSSDLKIYYRLPSEPLVFFEVVLFKNGRRIDHLNTSQGTFSISSPGVYRIQVRVSPRLPLPDAVKWLSWVYTNNFYIN